MFSKSCEYGILATIYIAQHSTEHNCIGLKKIADAEIMPFHFLSKVLQILVKKKILKSSRGLKGGFCLNKESGEINLMGIIDAIDGLDIFNNCILGLESCSEDRPCPIHKQYKAIKESFVKILTQTTLADLVEDIDNGISYLIPAGQSSSEVSDFSMN